MNPKEVWIQDLGEDTYWECECTVVVTTDEAMAKKEGCTVHLIEYSAYEDLKNKNAELVEALKFYANGECFNDDGFIWGCDWYNDNVAENVLKKQGVI